MRYLKTLGLALIAALAMSAVVASAASANAFSFHSDGSPTTLKGESTETTGDVFKTQGGEVRCHVSTYSGSIATATATSLTITPHYTDCGLSVVDLNGCDYVFNANTKEGSNYEGSVSIDCPTGNEITVTSSLFGTTKCVTHIPEQGPLTGITYTNQTKGSGVEDIEVDVNITTITYSQTAGTGIGACSTTHTGSGVFEGEVTVTGFNESNQETNIWVG